MFASFSNSWRLIKASANILNTNKSLLIYPFVSAIASIIVIISFFVPLAVSGLMILVTVAKADDAAPTSSAPIDLSGRWKGNWISESNGHKGPLQARITRKNDSEYRAVFRGRFFVVIPFRYATNLRIIEENGQQVILYASSNLGPFLGTFEATTRADNENFNSTFQAKDDRGQFNLRRR